MRLIWAKEKEGGGKMTNREWIESLTDEEWEAWLDAERD